MRSINRLFISFATMALLLSSCAVGGTSSSNAQQTAYAKTIAVMQTSVNASPTPDIALLTQEAMALTPTLSPAAPTPTALTTIYPSYLAGSVGDITVKDGTVFTPGEKFTKTWQITNKGTGTWKPTFKVIYYSGDQMGAPEYVLLDQMVLPGQSVQVSMNLTAPTADGSYTGYFLLQTDQGLNFGIGASGKDPFWVYIKVQTPLAVTDVSVVANPTTYTGACPVTIRLHAKIKAASAGTIIFHFVTSSGNLSQESVSLSAAGEVTSNGTNVIVSATGNFTADVYIDSPNHQLFSGITVPVTCN